MKKHRLSRYTIAAFLTVLLLTKQGSAQSDSAGFSVAIDTCLLTLKIDTSLLSFRFNQSYTFSGHITDAEYILIRNPTEADEQLYRKHKKLIGTEPNKKNYPAYYSLACALWELGKTEEAKQMFLLIMSSEKPYYCSTYYHSSDVGGRKRSGRYGYGSYTSNYKHYASTHLAKIHAEQKEYDKALEYVIAADTVYPLEYTCGTGHMMHSQYMQSFYVMCYEGQRNYNKVVDLLLTGFYSSDGALLRSLKKLYQPQAIRDSLTAALKSLTFVPDSLPTTYYSYERDDKGNEVKTEITFMSGTAAMCLFGRLLETHPRLMNQGETASRDWFIKEFLESGFYRALSEEE